MTARQRALMEKRSDVIDEAGYPAIPAEPLLALPTGKWAPRIQSHVQRHCGDEATDIYCLHYSQYQSYKLKKL